MSIFNDFVSGLAQVFHGNDDEERKRLRALQEAKSNNPIFDESSFEGGSAKLNAPPPSSAPFSKATQALSDVFGSARDAFINGLVDTGNIADSFAEDTFTRAKESLDSATEFFGENVKPLADKVGITKGVDNFMNQGFMTPSVPQEAIDAGYKPLVSNKQALGFLADLPAAIGHGFTRAITSTGLTLGNLMNPDTTMNQVNPEEGYQQFLLGNEPIKTFGATAKDWSGGLQKVGVPKNIADVGALPLVVGATGLDLFPLGTGEKKVAEGLGKQLIETVGKDVGDDVARQGVKELLGTTFQDFRQNLTAFMKSENIKPEVAKVIETIKQEVQGGSKLSDIYAELRGGINDAVSTAEKKAIEQNAEDIVKPVTENTNPSSTGSIEPPSGNSPPSNTGPSEPGGDSLIINEKGKLEKTTDPNKYVFDLKSLNTYDDVKETIRQVAQSGNEAVQSQRRGTLSNEQVRNMADALGMTQEEVLKRKPGTLWNPEEADAAVRLTLKAQEDLTAIGKQIKDLRDAGQEIPAQLELQLMEASTRAQGMMAAAIGNRSETGRALNAAKIIKESMDNPTSQALEKATKMFAGNVEKAKEVIGKLAQFDPEDNLGKMKFLREIKPSTPLDKLEEIWYNSILSGPATHVINQIGNTMTTFFRIPEKAIAGSLDAVGEKIAKAAGKEYVRDRFVAEAGAELTGVRSGFVDGLRRAMYVMGNGYSESQVSKFDIGRGQAIGGMAGNVINIPSRALVAGDELWKGVNYQMGLWSEAVRKAKQEGLTGEELTKRVADLVSNPDPKTVEMINELAKKRLFQGDSMAGNAVRYFRDNLVKLNLPVLGELRPMRFIIPFIQTPINVVKFGLEHSPAGFIGTGYDALNGASKAKTLDSLAANLLGSAMMVPLAFYATEGKLTGAAPTDRKQRDAFYADGKLPWSIKIGNRWVAYNRVEPFNTILAQIAMWHDAYEKEGKVDVKSITDFATMTGRNFADQTFMTGLGNIVNAIEDPERFGQKFITDIIGGFIPSFVAAGARSMDNTVRKPETILQSFEQRLPFASQNVPGQESAFEPGGVAIRHNQDNPLSTFASNFLGFRTSPDLGTDIQGSVKQVQDINKKSRDESDARTKTANEFISKMRLEKSKEKRQEILKEYLQSGKMDEETATKVVETLKEDSKYRGAATGDEHALKTASNKVKAEFIVTKMKGMNAEERKSYLSTLIDEGIVTENTAGEIVKYIQDSKKNLPSASP